MLLLLFLSMMLRGSIGAGTAETARWYDRFVVFWCDDNMCLFRGKRDRCAHDVVARWMNDNGAEQLVAIVA